MMSTKILTQKYDNQVICKLPESVQICNFIHVTNLQILWNFKNEEKTSRMKGSCKMWIKFCGSSTHRDTITLQTNLITTWPVNKYWHGWMLFKNQQCGNFYQTNSSMIKQKQRVGPLNWAEAFNSLTMKADLKISPTLVSIGKANLHSVAQSTYMQQHASKRRQTQSIFLFDWWAQAKRELSRLQ